MDWNEHIQNIGNEKVFKWLWIAILVVFPVLLIISYMQFNLEVWGVFLVLVFLTNAMFAILTMRSLKMLRENNKILSEKRAKESALLGSLGEGIVVTNKNGDVELINHQAELMMGWTAKEVVGKKWYEVAPLQNESGELVPPDRRATQVVLERGKPTYSSGNYYVRKDGTRFPVGTTAAPVIIDGKTVGVIAVFRDITREKEIDREKTEFVSLASHQLRTPLSAVKWYGEMLINGDAGPLNDEQKEFMGYLYHSNERMIELVNALLNISRIEMGRVRIEPVETSLEELVNQVLVDLKPKIKEKKLDVQVKANKDIPRIMVDPKLIRQVYLNLLSNALKYTAESGKVTVMIEMKDDELISEISDNGYGIPKDDQKRIFERFFRANNVQKVMTEGSGLGLYLVKDIVEASGGKIWFESEENKGSKFWFSLPKAGTPAKKGEVTID